MANNLLLVIAKEVKGKQEHYQPLEAIGRLKNKTKYLAEYKITQYFWKSFVLFSSWIPNLANGGEYMDESKMKKI